MFNENNDIYDYVLGNLSLFEPSDNLAELILSNLYKMINVSFGSDCEVVKNLETMAKQMIEKRLYLKWTNHNKFRLTMDLQLAAYQAIDSGYSLDEHVMALLSERYVTELILRRLVKAFESKNLKDIQKLYIYKDIPTVVYANLLMDAFFKQEDEDFGYFLLKRANKEDVEKFSELVSSRSDFTRIEGKMKEIKSRYLILQSSPLVACRASKSLPFTDYEKDVTYNLA